MYDDTTDDASVYDVPSASQIDLPNFETDLINASFDKTGRYLATFATDTRVRVWDVKSRTLIRSVAVQSHSGEDVVRVEGVFKSPGQDQQPQLVLAVDTASQQDMHTWDVLDRRSPSFFSEGFSARDVDVDANGRLAVATNKWVELVTKDDFEEYGEANKDYVTHVRFQPSNRHVFALATRAGNAELYDEGSSHPLWRFQGHRGPITSLEFSATGSHILTSSDDGTVRVRPMPMREVIWRRIPAISYFTRGIPQTVATSWVRMRLVKWFALIGRTRRPNQSATA